jgi:outer membrane protein
MRYILLIILVSTSCFVQAQAPQLTLEDAVNIALKHNLDIQIAKNNVDVNAVLNHISIAGGLPVVEGNLTNTESITTLRQNLNTGVTNSRNWAPGNNLAASVGATQLLFNGMRVVATRDRLNQLEKQSRQQLNAQVQNTMAAVMVQYYDVVRQENYIKTLLQSIEASKIRLKIVEVRKEAGYANNADLFQAQIDLNVLNQSLQSQELIVAQGKADLLNLINQSPDSLVTVKDTILVDKELVLPSLDQLYANPELLSADLQIRINEQIAKETRAQRYPTITATAGLAYNRVQNSAGLTLLNQNYGPTAGIGVNIPIFNGGAFRRQQKAAEINIKTAELQRQAVLQNLHTSLVKTWQSYQNTLQQLETEKKNYDLSRQLLDLSTKRLEYGQATIIEVRESQQSFEEAGYRLVNLSYAAKTAEIELKRLSGKLSL